MEILEESHLAQIEKAAEIGLLTPAVVSTLLTGERNTVESAIDPWKDWMINRRLSGNTIQNSETWVRAWARDTGCLAKNLMSIQAPDLDAWVNSPRRSNKLACRKVMLSALRSFFNFLSGRGWCMGNPAALVKVDPWPLLHEQKETHKQPVFLPEEVRFLLDMTAPEGPFASPFWHAAIAIGRYTGLRLSDVASLEWDCLGVPGKISVWTQKRDRRVEVPLAPEELEDALKALERTDRTFLFPEQREIVRDPRRRSILSNEFKRLCAKAGVSGKSFHALRATCATDMAQRGVPIEDIQAVLGHETARMTEGYIRPDQ